MRIIRDAHSLPEPPHGTVLTLGNFDGIHLGHQGIVREVVAHARAIGGTPVVMTFDPPPARVLGKSSAPQLMTLADRATLLQALGVELLVIQTFTPELAVVEPDRFVSAVLERQLRPEAVFVGYDFCFGKERRGDIHFLQSWFGSLGRLVRRIGPLGIPSASSDGQTQGDTIVSSSRIRRLLQEGQVQDAARFLGRPHFLRGTVVHGEARGRTLGFPTANLASATELVPRNGVYATWLRTSAGRFPGVTNIGVRPTFEGSARSIETHLLDFEPTMDLYGQEVELAFVGWIRDEMRFAGVAALMERIQVDIHEAHAFHALEPGGATGQTRRAG